MNKLKEELETTGKISIKWMQSIIPSIQNDGGILLSSGRLFKPLWPTPDTFTIEDIAYGLDGLNRFAGHSVVRYKVSQHCVIMAKWFMKLGMYNEARWALMHEGSEGLGLGDMPTPVKYLPEMEPYRVLCKNVDFAVYRKVGLLGNPSPIVKLLDNRMYLAEAKICYKNVPQYIKDSDTSDLIIKPYKKEGEGMKQFMKLFRILFPDYKESITY